MLGKTCVPAVILPMLAAAVGIAPAQGWVPQRNVEFVVPNGAGSSMDNNVRLIHKLWSELKHMPVSGTVVNRVGGEHVLAYNYIKQRTGDPHYLGLATSVLLTSHNRVICSMNYINSGGHID